MNILEPIEVWFDESPDSSTSKLRLAISASDYFHIAEAETPIFANFGGNGVVLGVLELRFLAHVKGLAILEAAALHSVGFEFPPQALFALLISRAQPELCE